MEISRLLCAFFFTELARDQLKCNKCLGVRKQNPGSGFSNLMSHLRTRHDGFEAESNEQRQRNTTSAYGFVDDHTSNIYDWMRLVIERNLPLCEVESKPTRELVRMEPTTNKTLMLFMEHVADRVGAAIASEMGSVFGLIFDGWTSGSVHYVALFAVYMVGDVRHQRLLAFSPMEDGQTVCAHVEFIEAVLRLYDKEASMIKFLVGDNCATNQPVGSHEARRPPRRLRQPSLQPRCHALLKLLPGRHRSSSRVDDPTALTEQFGGAGQAYRPPAAQSGRYALVLCLRHDRPLRDDQQRHPQRRGRLPTALCEKLAELDSVCKRLQDEKCSLADVRVFFDACVEKYPIMGDHLKPAAKILHLPTFEAAVVKAANHAPLSTDELESLAGFRVATSTTTDE